MEFSTTVLCYETKGNNNLTKFILERMSIEGGCIVLVVMAKPVWQFGNFHAKQLVKILHL